MRFLSVAAQMRYFIIRPHGLRDSDRTGQAVR
jgi:hypothetical protein